MSGDPIPRLFAAASALTGTIVLMVRSEPSWTGLLIGLSCLGLWGLGTLASKSGAPLPLTRPARPIVLKAVIVEPRQPPPELLLARPLPNHQSGANHQAGANHHEIMVRPTQLPEVPTYRQRVVGRQMRGGR